MKKRIFVSTAVALLTAASLSFAERPSSDETALQMGVHTWLAGRNAVAGRTDLNRLQPIYSADVEATAGGATLKGWSAYLAAWQPKLVELEKNHFTRGGDLKLTLEKNTATTAFEVRSEGLSRAKQPVGSVAQVTLEWERRKGLWVIVRENVVPTNEAAGLVTTAK